ncbi:DUF3703 domain-containing protein (plasmid) [Polaromonas sp. P1-6]|nr:DUF3703 domain-containing protein [Polaromonas sp. P1-6]
MQATDTETAWDFLSAAHIVGQTDFLLHCRVHWTMLLFAVRSRDGAEVSGQLFRLGLVPLGHVLRRLPLGNMGRSNVSAFQSMPVAPRLSPTDRKCRAKSSLLTSTDNLTS